MTPNDWEILARFGVTPDNLTASGWLDLRNTAITALPDNLTVRRWLDIRSTAIRALPDNLNLGGGLYPQDTAIVPLYRDPRGYRLDRAGDHYQAECRRFTAAEALAHWGSPDYPNRARGDAYCAAIRREEARRQE